jgi:hypothetical protein
MKLKLQIIIIALAVVIFSTCPLFSKSNEIDVYILSGQSNAVGYNHVKDISEKEFLNDLNETDVMFWAGSNSTKKKWIKLQPSVSFLNRQAFGPELSFGLDFNSYSKKNIAIIKYAVGGTGIAKSEDYHDYIKELANFDDAGKNWSPKLKNGKYGVLLESLFENIKMALNDLTQEGYGYKLKGFIWMQGEHEAGLSKQMAKDYSILLSKLVYTIRQRLNKPQLPFVIGQISDKWIYKDFVQHAQQSFCKYDESSILVKTKDLERYENDNSHYTSDATIELGRRFAKAMMKLNGE